MLFAPQVTEFKSDFHVMVQRFIPNSVSGKLIQF